MSSSNIGGLQVSSIDDDKHKVKCYIKTLQH